MQRRRRRIQSDCAAAVDEAHREKRRPEASGTKNLVREKADKMETYLPYVAADSPEIPTVSGLNLVPFFI
jgi:hypothetical protein